MKSLLKISFCFLVFSLVFPVQAAFYRKPQRDIPLLPTPVKTLQEIQKEAFEKMKDDPDFLLRQKRKMIQEIKPNGSAQTSAELLKKRRAGGGGDRFNKSTGDSISGTKKNRKLYRDTDARRNFHRIVNRSE